MKQVGLGLLLYLCSPSYLVTVERVLVYVQIFLQKDLKNLELKYETHIQPWDSKHTANLAGNVLFNEYYTFYFCL